MSDELPPPRYEQRGNWKHLITDEQEWLARPASWGIDVLPEVVRAEKRRHFDREYWPRWTEWIRCDHCRPVIRDYMAGDPGTFPACVSPNEDECRAWYVARHPDGDCEAWRMIRSGMHLVTNAILPHELFNTTVSALCAIRDARDSEDRYPTRRNLSNAWDRELALELIGPNPFRPVAFDPAWRTESVVALARGMYETRDFAPMPVLADALDDAGCADPDILAHCRGPGPHVRGCWVVDLVLGTS